MEEVPGSEKFFPAQLVFLSLGFLGPESALVKALDVKQDARSNIQTPPKVRKYFILGTLKDAIDFALEIFHQR
jgi:NADPH-dependent glutamate synthase beta subunit-like oxidoreductase